MAADTNAKEVAWEGWTDLQTVPIRASAEPPALEILFHRSRPVLLRTDT